MKVTDRQRRWWVGLLAAPMVLFTVVAVYAQLFGPQRPGWTGTPSADGYLIQAIQPESPAARAGLLPGDRLLGWDGLPVGGDLLAVRLWHAETGRTYRLDVLRTGERRAVSLRLASRTQSQWGEARSQADLILLAGAVIYLIVALVIAFARPNDSAARWGALFLALNTVGAIDVGRDLGGVGTLHTFVSLSPLVGALYVVLVTFQRGTIASACLTFLATFPNRLFRSRWIWAAIWAPALPSIPILFYWLSLEVFSPATFPGRGWTRASADVAMVAALTFAPLLVASNYRRLQDINQRRRLRVIVSGFAGSLLAVMSTFFALYAFEHGRGWSRALADAYLSSPMSLVAVLLYPAFALSIAYAILRHRLFDIRVMVRQGLQYAAARGLLLSLVPLVGVVFVLDLLLHGDQPLAGILVRRGWFYAALAIGGFAAHKGQKAWLATLDRHFFRERYDAERILHAVVDEIRQAGGVDDVALRVVSRIEAALHPEAAALLIRQPQEPAFRVLATSPGAIRPIPIDSTLMGLLRLLGKPLEVSQSETGWLRQQLPPRETEFLREVRLEWIFPISLAVGKPEALLVVGPKRSEEPYSREDLNLLEGVTAGLALLLERVPASAAAKAISVPSPAVLANRYRLDREIGRGGMGAVFEAFDTELERPVAVKLILAELTRSSEALVRFKREAKAAAGFSHPNVVTVHDFGVAEDNRAYLVMELLHGCTLREDLRRQGRVPAPRALEILRGICGAVGAAHERRILHRDLKPENIFLADIGGLVAPKILDFGVVKALAAGDETLTRSDTEPGALIGTPKYMSPEQLCGEPPEPSWDLWALAVVGYEMLTGAHPFAGAGRADWRNALLAGRVAPPREHLDAAPASWETLFTRILSPDRSRRPATAAGLLAEFEQVVN